MSKARLNTVLRPVTGRLRDFCVAYPCAAGGVVCILACTCFLCIGGLDGRFDSNQIVILACAGAVLAVAAGYLLGRGVLRQVEASGRWSRFLVGHALFSFFFAAALLNPPFAVRSWERMNLSAAVLAGAIALVFSNSYLASHAIVAGRRRVGRRSTLGVLLLTYGGVALGIWAGFATRGLIKRGAPMPAWWGFLGKKMSWDEAFEEAVECFHPWIRIVEKTPESLTIETSTIGASGSFWNTIRNHETHYDRIVCATGPVVELNGSAIKFVGYTVYPPHQGKDTHPSQREYSPTIKTFAPDGAPLPTRVGGVTSEGPIAQGFYQAEFHVEIPEKVRFLEDDWETVFLPWEIPLGAESGWGISADPIPPDGHRDASFNTVIRLPIPGPAELRLNFQRRAEQTYTLPARKGSSVELDRNVLFLGDVIPGAWPGSQGIVVGTQWTSCCPPPSRKITWHAPHMNGKASTFFLFQAFPDEHPDFIIQAVTRDGRILDPRCSAVGVREPHHDAYLFTCTCPCPMDEVDHFLINEIHLIQVRFPTEAMPCFPQENQGCENLLDLRIPRVFFDDELTVERFVRYLQTCTLRPSWFSPAPPVAPPKVVGKVTVEQKTVREILDAYYPDFWYVENGRIKLGNPSPAWRGTILEVIRSALSYLIEPGDVQF